MPEHSKPNDTTPPNDTYMELCLRGKELYGDNFTVAQIASWFEDEKEGYFNLTSGSRNSYQYGYHQLNTIHGYQHLPDDKTFKHTLGVGSAYGDELRPILDRCQKITILEPSEGFRTSSIEDVPLTYQSPDISGSLPFEDNSFDLIVCFGVLHHIPNVSKVLTEFYRCLEPGGYALIREPINSMGDWRKTRRGLTKHERGIPKPIFNTIIENTGFNVVKKTNCMFSLTSRLRYIMNKPVYNSRLAILLDKAICTLPIWPNRYHPSNFWHKLRPTSIFYVLRKI